MPLRPLWRHCNALQLPYCMQYWIVIYCANLRVYHQICQSTCISSNISLIISGSWGLASESPNAPFAQVNIDFTMTQFPQVDKSQFNEQCQWNGAGTRFTNDFSIIIWIRGKFHFALIQILRNWSWQNFAHETTAMKLWYLQPTWWPAMKL